MMSGEQAPGTPATVEVEQDPGRYELALGDRLRNVRQQQGMSLHDVERRSGGDLKASVVGAYERGERAVSVARLQRLAQFYHVPIRELLPETRVAGPLVDERPSAGLQIDLTRLDSAELPELSIVGRFVDTIRTRRGDYNGRVLTIRAADLQALAAVLDQRPTDLEQRLVGAGIARAG